MDVNLAKWVDNGDVKTKYVNFKLTLFLFACLCVRGKKNLKM